MRFCFELLLASLLLPRAALSMLAEDAGILDFTIRTTGHGVTRFVEAYDEGTILTSDAPSSTRSDASASTSTSCYVSSRKIDDGSLVWRRNVCSNSSEDQHHAMATFGDHFYTMDHSGIVRAWTQKEGNLVWDAQVAAPTSPPRVFAFANGDKNYVAVGSDGDLTILKADTGTSFDTVNALKALGYKPKNGEVVQWLSVLPDIDAASGPIRALLAFVKEDGSTSGSRIMLVDLDIGDDTFKSTKALGHLKASVVASSLQVQQVGAEWHALAVTADASSAVHFSLEHSKLANDIPAASWHPNWTSVVAVRSTPNPSVVTLQGTGTGEGSQETMALFRFDDATSSGWEKLHGLQEPVDTQFNAIAYCSEAQLVVAMTTDSLKVYRQDSLSAQADSGADRHERLSPLTPITVAGDMFSHDGDAMEGISVIGCTADTVTTLLSTVGGTTTQLTFTAADNAVTVKMGWATEEGLASASSAIILDASHLGVDDLVEEQGFVNRKLSLPSRFSSQWSNILGMLTGAVGGSSRRDHLFGFVKVAALLSQTSHRVWGVDTSGENRGTVRWSLDLPKTADWHTMVHGTINSAQALHGINGGTHSREILTLSASSSSVEWKCIDGTNGAVHAQETVQISSPVIQVIPMHGGSGGCRQTSLLLHEDLTLSVVPADQETMALVEQQLKNTPNGLYTHIVDTANSKVESFQVAETSGEFVPRLVGRASFAGERIVKVAYPTREEVIQSLCTVLGDESLLLKYVNPHLAVVVTVSKEDNLATSNLVSSIEKSQGTKKYRKPTGAGDAPAVAEPASDEGVPNMFVNLIDTVSGRVLHRASHSNVDPSREVTALVSENWIIYTFVNAKTRRTELGVLTLHEGMIDSKGLSLFSSPEQTTTFSSFDARISKPVVLAKTYTFPKAITALGATATRGGISSRKILIASSDGKITSVDRAMLETRRPMGEVKDVEKKEGLFPYSELIPQISPMALTYNQTIDSVTSIVTAPTSLESQSLILAFGGPDLFFTRTSPSKGFDLLPDSFSRLLVSIVSVSLVIVLFVVKRIGNNKALKQGWL
jgi:hypothetical protein